VSWADERARFPVFQRHAYLNAGTFGPLAEDTIAAVDEVRRFEAHHGRAGRAFFDAMLERRERIRGLVAGHLNVDPVSVALTESTSQGVQIVVLGLGIGLGDEVVTTDVEHFGLAGPLAASRASLEIVSVRDVHPDDLYDVLVSRVSPRTRLIALSAVSWLDGSIFPWRELREATGVPILVDGAQSVGAIPVAPVGADFYTVSGQKWLCGPDLTGALYIAEPKGLVERILAYPGVESYDVGAGTWVPKDGARRFDPSFGAASSLAGFEAALTDLPAGRFEHAAELVARCRELLLDGGHDVVTAAGQGTLVSWRHVGDTAVAAAALYERGVVIRELPGTGLLRASVGWWNDESDLDRLVDALAEI
jgi:L-cysteine/cystine lyase